MSLFYYPSCSGLDRSIFIHSAASALAETAQSSCVTVKESGGGKKAFQESAYTHDIIAEGNHKMSFRETNLHTADLENLLHSIPAVNVEQLARLIVAVLGPKRASTHHLQRSLQVRGLEGHQLIPDIVDDLVDLASHTTGPRLNFREQLRHVAGRHGIQDNGKLAPVEVERQIQLKYLSALRPEAHSFKDKGSDALLKKVGYAFPGAGWIAWAMSPNWDVVTAALLEIAALRRIELTRTFRRTLENWT